MVTGFGGFLGSEICRQLLARGYRVRGVARGQYPELERLGVESVQGDLGYAEIGAKACAGVDGIIHTAALAGVWGPASHYVRANITATEHLIRAAKKYHVPVFVFTSSPSVTFAGQPQANLDESTPYPTHWLCHYPRTKAISEQKVLAANSDEFRTCALRPHLIWGDGDPHLIPRLIQRCQTGRLRRIGPGTNLIDTVHVEAAANSHVLAYEQLAKNSNPTCAGKSYFITDGTPVPCWEWLSSILQLAGLQPPDKHLSLASAYRIGQALEWSYKVLRKKSEPPMTRFVAKQLGLDHYFDIQAAKRDLGYVPIANRQERFLEMEPWLLRLAADG